MMNFICSGILPVADWPWHLYNNYKDKNIKPFPTKTVLLSPWLDISLENKDIPVYENKDHILSRDALTRVGKLYAGKVNVKDTTVSPLFGNMDGLGNILLLFCAYELFYPDCMLLIKAKLEKAKGTIVESHIFCNRMVHDWILMPIPEANKTIQFIGDWFNK